MNDAETDTQRAVRFGLGFERGLVRGAAAEHANAVAETNERRRAAALAVAEAAALAARRRLRERAAAEPGLTRFARRLDRLDERATLMAARAMDAVVRVVSLSMTPAEVAVAALAETDPWASWPTHTFPAQEHAPDAAQALVDLVVIPLELATYAARRSMDVLIRLLLLALDVVVLCAAVALRCWAAAQRAAVAVRARAERVDEVD